MNQLEALELTNKVSLAWGSWNREDRMELLVEKLLPYEYKKARGVINKLIDTQSHAPTIADLKENLSIASKGESLKESVCEYCDNTGWVFKDNVGLGTVIKCYQGDH